jgi:hypothetical protein
MLTVIYVQYLGGALVQWPEHEADCSLSSGAETKNAAIILSL